MLAGPSSSNRVPRRETTIVSVWAFWLAAALLEKRTLAANMTPRFLVGKGGALMNNRRSLSRTLPGRPARRQQRAAVQLGAARLGAAAVGAAAVGAGAIGALAIGRLVVGRAVVRHLKIERLEVNRLHVHELQVDRQTTPAPA